LAGAEVVVDKLLVGWLVGWLVELDLKNIIEG
jgi:hypothetical protein